jgi:hypothetical protein
MLPISWSLRLVHLTVLLLVFFSVSLFTIPMCIKNIKGAGALVIVQAVLIALLEEVLFEQREGGFYSPFLIFFTSILGLVMASSLYGSQRINITQACVLMSGTLIPK